MWSGVAPTAGWMPKRSTVIDALISVMRDFAPLRRFPGAAGRDSNRIGREDANHASGPRKLRKLSMDPYFLAKAWSTSRIRGSPDAGSGRPLRRRDARLHLPWNGEDGDGPGGAQHPMEKAHRRTARAYGLD